MDCFATARNDSLNYSEVDKKTEKEIEGLVEKIIENKKEGIDTENEERDIDKIVYKLYNLNDGEVRLIKENK